MRGADNSSDNDLWLGTDELEEEGIGGVEEERKKVILQTLSSSEVMDIPPPP